ncbi:choice-of-anchor Q domain-containing protein, partial [Phaeodactylibacter sp.]|uniref:choice-of-anchor Q domain-containing protein n=2 Tax=Phaeodactylibacter sp. TaxID=1940289 RepID=UPI0025E10CD7
MKYVQLILLFMLISFGLAATTINVTTTTDEDNGFLGGGNGISLREAIIYSSSGDEIVLSGSTYVLTLTSTEEGFNLTPGTGDLDIQHDLTITGNGATIDANGIDRVIQIASGVEVVIDHVTITGGRSTFTPGVNLLTHGGGIYTEGDLTLNNCSLDDNISITHGGNQSSQGGGIYNLSGVLTLNDCTISNNQAGTANQGQHGGGIYNSTTGTLNMTGCTALNNKANDQPLGAGDGGAVYSLGAITLTNCTFSGNTASRFGGGVTFHGDNPSLINFCTITNNTAFKGGGIFSGLDGSGDIANTIIAGNTSTDNLEDADVLNDYNSLGYNLIGIFPNANNDLPLSSDHFGTSGSPLSANLSPLASNGGPTQTHALLSNSPALNGANPNATVTEDQRGTQRPQDCPSDIGAYESSLSTLSPSTYYADTDMDGFGDPNNSTQACIQPDGFVTNSSDCNDNDSAINPDATEACDGVDNNCDTQIDEGTLATYYADSDSDGFGDPNNSTQACAQPSGFVS